MQKKPIQPAKEQPKLPSGYLYQTDNRSESEKFLSLRITKMLTEINLKRMKNFRATQADQSTDYHFICYTGAPPMAGQFQNLELPGPTTILSMTGATENPTQEQSEQIFQKISFESQAEVIRTAILKVDPNRKIVMMYHSYGTYPFLFYLKAYSKDHRISGIIDIGGAPIRFYPVLRNLISSTVGAQPEFLLENAEIIHQGYLNQMKGEQLTLPNKYQTINFIKIFQTQPAHQLFELNRQLPDLLKLFIFGSRDHIFPETLAAEKAMHYCYGAGKLSDAQDDRYCKAYQQLYGTPCSNAQERFVLDIQNAKHSLHMQQKHIGTINMAIQQYLNLLSLCDSN